MTVNSKGMKCSEFVELMKERGYIYDEKNGGFITGHGKKAGKLVRNGYRTLSLQKGKEFYTFCEHRCVWVWFNGEIEEGMVINHKDFDRQNNRIENLEVMTQKENTRYTIEANRANTARGERSGKAIWTNKEVQAMRHLRKHGWNNKSITNFFGGKYSSAIGRLINGARYGSVPDAADVLTIYPTIVLHTMNKSLSREEQLANAAIGLCGECGEVADIVKKHLYQGHDLEMDWIMEELGDIMYYLTLMLVILDFEYADMLFNNMAKLKKRYPDGFSKERSLYREE